MAFWGVFFHPLNLLVAKIPAMTWLTKLKELFTFGDLKQAEVNLLTPESKLNEIEITRLAREYLAGEGDFAIYQNYKNGTKSRDFLTGLRESDIPEASSRIEVPRYPRYSEGFPVTGLEEMIASQRPLIRKIYTASSLKKEDFLALIVPIIWNFAGLVHLLPASQGNHHSGPGGAFRHGLEVAFLALKSAYDTYIPTNVVAPRYRAHVIKQWYVAIFISALGHDLGKLLTDFHVVAARDEPTPTWNPFTQSLYDWAIESKLERYYLVWVTGRYRRHEGKGPALLPRLVSGAHLDWIMTHTRDPFESMMACLTAPDPSTNLIARLVLGADAKSSDSDMRSRIQNEGDPGLILEQGDRIIVSSIRRLWRTNTWRLNEPGGRLWVPDDKTVYVIWEAATKDIGKDLVKHTGKAYLPDEPEAMARLMVEGGVAKAFIYQGHEHLLHAIRLPAMSSKENPEGPLAYALKADLSALLGIVTSPSYAEVVEVTPEGDPIAKKKRNSNTDTSSRGNGKAAQDPDPIAPAQGSLPLDEEVPSHSNSPIPDKSTKGSVAKVDHPEEPPSPRVAATSSSHEKPSEPLKTAKKGPASEKRSGPASRKGERCLELPDGVFIPFNQLKMEEDDLLIPVETVEKALGKKGSELLDFLKSNNLIEMRPRRQSTPLVTIGGERFFLLHEPLIVRKDLAESDSVPDEKPKPKAARKSDSPKPSGEAGDTKRASIQDSAPGNGAVTGKDGVKPKKKPSHRKPRDTGNQQELPIQKSKRNDGENSAPERQPQATADETPYEIYRRDLWLRFMESSQETDDDEISIEMLAEQVAWLSDQYGLLLTKPRLLERIGRDQEYYENTNHGIFIRR